MYYLVIQSVLDPKCVELGWQCIPLAVKSDGALRAFSRVATWLAIRGNTPKSKVIAELYGRLSLLLVRANAQSPNTPTRKCTVHIVVLCVCVHLCVFCLHVLLLL